MNIDINAEKDYTVAKIARTFLYVVMA
jgi:hypothetical protein